jgi:hypothetical protein
MIDAPPTRLYDLTDAEFVLFSPILIFHRTHTTSNLETLETPPDTQDSSPP